MSSTVTCNLPVKGTRSWVGQSRSILSGVCSFFLCLHWYPPTWRINQYAITLVSIPEGKNGKLSGRASSVDKNYTKSIKLTTIYKVLTHYRSSWKKYVYRILCSWLFSQPLFMPIMGIWSSPVMEISISERDETYASSVLVSHVWSHASSIILA